jgi:hypothetical protein
MAMAMRRNHPSFMIAVGMPRFAHEPQDEDDLHREDEGESSGNVENLIGRIFRKLHEGDEATARAVMQLSEALAQMVKAGQRGRDDALEQYANLSADIINHIESDDGEED